LAKPERVSTIIGEELTSIKQEFGQHKLGARRSIVEYSAQDLSTEDLITPTDMVVTLSHTGYIKRQPPSEYRAHKRGGRGKPASTSWARAAASWSTAPKTSPPKTSSPPPTWW